MGFGHLKEGRHQEGLEESSGGLLGDLGGPGGTQGEIWRFLMVFGWSWGDLGGPEWDLGSLGGLREKFGAS